MLIQPPRVPALRCSAAPVVIRHPHYPEDQNTLLRFPRLDVASRRDETDSKCTYGAHYGTVLSACQIVAGNASTAFLSHDRRGKTPVLLGYDDVLIHREYFLQVPQGRVLSQTSHPFDSGAFLGIDDLRPFAILCDFEVWQFPHDGLPEAWACLDDIPAVTTFPAHGCILSGGLTTQPAHLVPKSQSSWFCQNRMGDYIANRGRDFGPGNASNTCRLHEDLLGDFDRRAFALVPKRSPRGYCLVAHYLSTSDNLSYPANVFHNQTASQLEEITRELLFTRFAYAIFGLVQTFTEQTRRVAIIEPGRDEFGLSSWVTNVYQMSPVQVAARRMQLASRPLKKRRLSESGLDDEHHHGPAPSRPLLTEQPQPLVEPRHPFSARRQTCTADYLRNPRHPLTFTDLPPEVRLLVWEATWPGPRLIGFKTAGIDDESTDEIEDYARLEVLCGIASMPSWLPEDRYPIALSICAESRKHTMKHFCLFRHHEQITWSLYLNPTCDVLAASDMCYLEEEDLINLWRSYGRQLARMKKLVLDTQYWDIIDKLDFLRYLGGIEVIQLYLEDDTTPAEISKLLGDIKLRYQNDNRYCSRFQLVDQAHKVRGEAEVTEHN
ncbi:hypothetical protein ACJZ2D_016824 [Fusarium nematophilum]